jgi:K+-sensing histidine kinase KdpD
MRPSMINYLHDIRNKLALISGHATILSKKYGAEDFIPIHTNVMRINDLVNNVYSHFCAKDSPERTSVTTTVKDFVSQMDVLTDALKLIFPLEIQNEVLDFKPNPDWKILYNIELILQIMENAIGNSINANSTKIYVRVLEVDSKCIIELVDNGQGKKEPPALKKDSTIPHGLGTKIMRENMTAMNGKAEWIRRFDGNGMIVRLYFPITVTRS